MDIIQCILQFLQINESELIINGQSLNLNLNSLLLVCYFMVSVLTKRAVFMAAFFMSCLLFDMSAFDQLSESQLYCLTFAIYSYVIFCNGLTFLTKASCGIILVSCIASGYDAYFYGINGVYGASETFVYNNIEYLALYAHIVLICTLIPYRRITNSIRRFLDHVMYMPSYSVNFTLL